eukprot:8688331-Alexandrium_andersonii.AAC.1
MIQAARLRGAQTLHLQYWDTDLFVAGASLQARLCDMRLARAVAGRLRRLQPWLAAHCSPAAVLGLTAARWDSFARLHAGRPCWKQHT